MDNEDLLRRPYAAYFRMARGAAADQPSAAASGVLRRKGLWYVVLRNVRGTLAVYRVKNDGALRRLRRWPKDFEER